MLKVLSLENLDDTFEGQGEGVLVKKRAAVLVLGGL